MTYVCFYPPDKAKKTRPSVVQLAKGGVEEVKFKGHEMCLKLTSTAQGERTIHLSFTNQQEYNKWYRKCKKVAQIFIDPLTAGAVHIRFLHFYQHIAYQLLNPLKIKSDINQQDLTFVDLHFVKSE